MKLSPRKELAARLIAAGHTQVDVYRDTRIAVTKQTMSAWCHEPDFISRVEELKIDIVANVQEILIKSAPEAAETLIGLVTTNGNGEKMGNEDSKIAALKLKGSLWILDRVLGKAQLKRKDKLSVEDEEEDDEFAPDDEEIDSVIDALN